MEPLNWTGVLGTVLDPLLLAASALIVLGSVAQVALGVVGVRPNPDGTASALVAGSCCGRGRDRGRRRLAVLAGLDRARRDLFLFPIVFFVVLWNSRFYTQPAKRNLYVGLTLALGLWAYSGLAFNADPLGVFGMDPNLLNVFVAVVFVNAPTVFRIVRGLVLDIRTRGHVAAGQTRGEGPWYIMLWKNLPNARGPLIVDFCLRIGYTTILLGTLGVFGLGVSPESPDWGSTINSGLRLLSIYPHPAVVPALALMSLVLGLNLLADGLREESLRD